MNSPLTVQIEQFLLPCRFVSGKGCELLVTQPNAGVAEFGILAVSLTEEAWEDVVSKKHTALHLLLRGVITDALHLYLGQKAHHFIGTTEPFLFAAANRPVDMPRLCIGCVFKYDLDQPPRDFRWVSFEELNQGENSVIRLWGPSEDPTPFNDMVANAMKMFIKQVC